MVCNSRIPGSLRLADARERYGESRRLAKSNWCRFEGWTVAEQPGTQRLWAKRIFLHNLSLLKGPKCQVSPSLTVASVCGSPSEIGGQWAWEAQAADRLFFYDALRSDEPKYCAKPIRDLPQGHHRASTEGNGTRRKIRTLLELKTLRPFNCSPISWRERWGSTQRPPA